MNKYFSGFMRTGPDFIVPFLLVIGGFFVISCEKKKELKELPVDQFSQSVYRAIHIELPELRVPELLNALEMKGRGNHGEPEARIRLADAYLDLGGTENAVRQLELCKIILAQPPTTGNEEFDQALKSEFGYKKHPFRDTTRIFIYKVEKRLGRHPKDENPAGMAKFLFYRAGGIESPVIRKGELLFALAIEHVPDYVKAWPRIRLADTYLDLGDTENAVGQLKQCKSILARTGVEDFKKDSYTIRAYDESIEAVQSWMSRVEKRFNGTGKVD